ncbi:hypothetical protein QUB09_00260, partial [Microcoleus sp. C2C6]|uniref:hypothetical protein n=1 Tax=Microcoleus sp. C2C6 TaxID=3055325 RepID=UPI002FD310DD
NVLTADDKGFTLIHADREKRDRNNSNANRFEIIYLWRPSQGLNKLPTPNATLKVSRTRSN